jgi:hypothetical protein
MNENIIKFPTPENVRIGFYELKETEQKFSNLFKQTLDPDRKLNSRESIHSVQGDVNSIKSEISTSIDKIDGLRPGMPTPEEFKEQVWELLCMPLEFGTGRAAMDYYGTENAFHELAKQYEEKRTELKKAALQN